MFRWVSLEGDTVIRERNPRVDLSEMLLILRV